MNDLVTTLEARIEALEMSLIGAAREFEALRARIAELEDGGSSSGRDYGPKSETKMTRIIAWRIKFGDRKNYPVKENAKFFKLSPGQIYSLRGYTFTDVKEDSFTLKDI